MTSLETSLAAGVVPAWRLHMQDIKHQLYEPKQITGSEKALRDLRFWPQAAEKFA
jgi:hypothetical protein